MGERCCRPDDSRALVHPVDDLDHTPLFFIFPRPCAQLWSFEHARHEGCCDEMHQAPVTCLAFLDPFPILLSTDAAGYIALWALPPARMGLRWVAPYWSCDARVRIVSGFCSK